MQTCFRCFQDKKRVVYVIFHVFDVNNNVRGKNRDQRAEIEKRRFDSFGPDGLKRPNKKRHKRETSHAMHSPRNPTSPDSRFPRKRSSGPLDGGFQRMASCGSFILSRDSPDSVISGPGPLMPVSRIAPPHTVTIPCVRARSKRENAAGSRKNGFPAHFFQGGQVCCTSFASDGHPRRKKNRTRKRSPDAAKFGIVSTRSVRAKSAHFGMRNCGIGICWS